MADERSTYLGQQVDDCKTSINVGPTPNMATITEPMAPPNPPPSSSFPQLEILDHSHPHMFINPSKCINEGHDVPRFLTSKAYRDIGVFIMQLNRALCPRKNPSGAGTPKTFPLVGGNRQDPESVCKLRKLLDKVAGIIDEAPPDPGPRRFGNISFRKWYSLIEERVEVLLSEFVPADVLNFGFDSEKVTSKSASPIDELRAYFLGGFGSPQRLDFGTGHELSFLAFLGCLWKLGAFKDGSHGGGTERSIVLGVFEPYVFPLLGPQYFSHQEPQVPECRTPSHSNLHLRTCRIAWSLGSRRSLLHALHIRFGAVHAADHRGRSNAVGGICRACTQAWRCAQG